MKYDIILCGVGGQGVLSVGAIISIAAMESGHHVKQSEVHGMAQRGGAVLANLRIADSEIASDLIPRGRAEMILSMEPLESLRYIDYLSPEGVLVASKNPVENINDYPELDSVYSMIAKLPDYKLIDSQGLAREAGSIRATNMVMVGAASTKLPIEIEKLEEAIHTIFDKKGVDVVDTNLRALHLGRNIESGVEHPAS